MRENQKVKIAFSNNVFIFAYRLNAYTMATTLQVKDKMLLSQKGISEEKLESQLQSFRNGFPFLKLYAAAAPKKGILQPSNEAQQAFLSAWQKYLTEGHKDNKVCSGFRRSESNVQRPFRLL